MWTRGFTGMVPNAGGTLGMTDILWLGALLFSTMLNPSARDGISTRRRLGERGPSWT